MKPIKVDLVKNEIRMTNDFFKKAQDPRSNEYAELQRIKADNPTFRVVKHTIKRNPNKESYKGLTYDYMRMYILTHVDESKVGQALMDLQEQIVRSQCHSKRYPIVKKWFLKTYPEITKYGMDYEPTIEMMTHRIIAVTDETQAA